MRMRMRAITNQREKDIKNQKMQRKKKLKRRQILK